MDKSRKTMRYSADNVDSHNAAKMVSEAVAGLPDVRLRSMCR